MASMRMKTSIPPFLERNIISFRLARQRVILVCLWKSRVGVAESVYLLGYGLDDRGSILGKDRNFSFRHRIQAVSGAHPVSYPRGTGDSFAGG
jgi:hypothetical protein